MREIQVEEKRYILKYEATDGTIFLNPEECKKYEESAKGVLEGRLSKLVVAKQNAWDLMAGYDDNEVWAIKISSKADKDVVLQRFFLDSPYLLDKGNEGARAELERKIDDAYKNKDLLLIGRNLEDELYMIGSRNTYVEKLQSLG